MAEEVPVSEVLFNATEYLCKLGSNLRSRSQNLKEKRISKDKLRNTHAVRKAASKLLLMCELSKKSLENVENGVKKVLTIVDASMCSPSVGAKNKTVPKRSDSKKDCFYFEYDSCKLRISKKIVLKHYTSVKVHAKRMPASMLDKYPVFCKCKLYQRRKKSSKKSQETVGKKLLDEKLVTTQTNDENTNGNTDDEKSEKSVNQSENKANSGEKEEPSSSIKKTSVERDVLNNDEKARPIIENNNSDDNTSSTKFHSDSTKKSKSVNESKEICRQNSDHHEDSEKCLSDTEVEKNDHILKSPNHPDKPASPILTKKLEPSDSTKLETKESEKGRHSLDSNEIDKTNSKTENKNVEKDKNKSENSRKSNMSKSVKFMDDSSNSSHASGVVEDSEKNQSKCDRENESKKEKIKEPEVINLSDDSPEKAKKSDGNGEKTSKKPFLKLVSLNKLLKPDVLKNVAKNIDVSKNSVRKTYGNKKQRMDTDWIEKKKQVLEFKPKKFNIVVIRMPDKFSDEYLCKYHLKKITKEGTIVHKLSSDLSKLTTRKLKENTKRNGTQNTVSIELSDESDENDLTTDGNKNKQSEVDLQSEKNNTSNKEDEDAQKSNKRDETKNNQSTDSNKEESDKNSSEKGNKKEIVSNEDSVKPAEPPKTPEGKNEKKDKTTPRSKRKLIMQSMRAKRMLLTHSSSSDTDDDQLRNALSDIKKALLHGSSSEEEINLKKVVQSNKSKLSTSSDSDDSVKIFKKKKKNPFDEKEQDETSSISQVDGTHDDQSNSSSSQMGRSKTKVGSSSHQSSETVDSIDIEINRLTNPITLNRSRRRGADKPATRGQRMPKAPPIKDEMLEPESSGSAVSEVASDAGDVEELPPIAVQELNGDGINHLAKEDLLAQSDSSSSQNDKEGSEDKKEDSEDDDDDDKLKSRRRKPHAIDSDSEVGSSRPKADKVSDFEDSEAESEPRKKSKRKKKGTDSDGSSSSNDGSKKKRRRIKQVNDSDGSGSDTENEGKNKHGRKNIRKVMSKNQLEEATKKAARQEKERVARIAERQKQYNNLEFDESGKPDEVVLDKVILDFDPDTKQPLIEVDRGLVKKLKPHQANGIKFMWNACFESVKRIRKDRGSGCILAHCMGLGKTLQVVSLTHTLLVHKELTKVKRVLVVCPLSTVLNWVNEFTMWLKHAESDLEVDVFELSRHKQNSERAWQLQQWVECGGVCVLGYEMFRNLSADNNKKFKKKMLKTFQEALVDPGPDLVVCDEGHLLKNEKTSLSQSMNRVRTLRRIVLTGTPLQNNLKEYYCMVQFVKPNLLGKYNEYLNRFVNPITNGQYTDSTEKDISIMKRRSHVLHTMLDGAVQRRDYGVLAPFLPPKHEFVLFITLTEIQTKLYKHYLENYSRRPLPGKSSGFLFPDFQSLQRIWTHPLVLKYNSERYEIMQQKKRDKEEEDSEGSLADFIDDDSTPEESSTEESSDDLSDASDDSRKKKKKKSAKKGKSHASGRRGTRANPVEQLEEERPNPEVEEAKMENPTEWWMKLVSDDELEDIRHSHKLLLLFDILRQCEAIGDKLLVFSQSLYSLDLIEHFLGKVDEATQEGRIDEKLAGHVGSWSPGVDYFRLDGSTSCENRSIWCKNFNREDNPRARLFLISTRAGGLGINLVAANRVVIFDVSWNPSHDVQSIFRVYRFGQKKPCYIYRFLAMGTMEEKIYERQVTKQAISKRVIDEQQIDRHYAANDLAELYRFEPSPAEPRPVPSLPKDRLFAEMLKEHEAAIYRFHEHDSLLENKEEETLSEEERKRAWEEFENEKKAPPPSPFPNSWAFTNGMAASLLQQQQQQLAYAALAAMIRKDMPNVSENQIRDMLPIICNANPGMFGGYDYGLMQKMSEIYKYAQPGMMNPSMMNPVMNPAGGGMSTSSSLQYEPPWQRQQQQQQQMRLQQLMQQQSMGAKYYAGGLGSRDPVAMALQQQRAREFLLSGGGGAGGGGGGGERWGAARGGRAGARRCSRARRPPTSSTSPTPTRDTG